MEKIKIKALEKTLKDLGIEKAKIETKDRGMYWLSIKEGFKIFKSKSGDEVVLNINGFLILIENYASLLWHEEGELKKSIFLKPIIPPRA